LKIQSRLERLFAPTAIHRQLYPGPEGSLRLRQYGEADRDGVVRIYRANAPGRFPAGHQPEFERYIDGAPQSLFVAELKGREGVVACGGVMAVSDVVHTLCYGMVSPEHQGRGIGSTLALARLVFATRKAGTHFSFIFAVPRSIGFYRRFGYREAATKWRGPDGGDNPIAMLSYTSAVASSIERILGRRGHCIDASIGIDPSTVHVAEVTKLPFNRHLVKLVPIAQAAAKPKADAPPG
jgi:GNAT superfamily N-acetyltransferase